MNTEIIHNTYKGKKPIKRILIIRLQATGDVMITLPYLQSLRTQLPKTVEMDMLVRQETESVPKGLTIFNRVYSLRGKRSYKRQFLSFLLLYPKLFFRRYDVIIDLQNHRLSNVFRKLLCVKTYSLFDKFSPNYAGERNKNTINALGIASVDFTALTSFKEINLIDLFKKFSLSLNTNYIVINPAGAFKNRNWGLNNYIEFCLMWNKNSLSKATFLILGIRTVSEKARFLKQQLGDQLIDLSGKTSFIEAVHILRNVSLVISEDSGLMHASYIVGTPTIGILGSTRSDWVNPKLSHTRFFTSADLPCGNCMLNVCLHKEIICLERLRPQDVYKASQQLLVNVGAINNF